MFNVFKTWITFVVLQVDLSFLRVNIEFRNRMGDLYMYVSFDNSLSYDGKFRADIVFRVNPIHINNSRRPNSVFVSVNEDVRYTAVLSARHCNYLRRRGPIYIILWVGTLATKQRQ